MCASPPRSSFTSNSHRSCPNPPIIASYYALRSASTKKQEKNELIYDFNVRKSYKPNLGIVPYRDHRRTDRLKLSVMSHCSMLCVSNTAVACYGQDCPASSTKYLVLLTGILKMERVLVWVRCTWIVLVSVLLTRSHDTRCRPLRSYTAS